MSTLAEKYIGAHQQPITAIPRNKPPWLPMATKLGGGLLRKWPKSPNFQILLRIYTCEKFSPLRGKMATKPGGFVAKGGGFQTLTCSVFPSPTEVSSGWWGEALRGR